MTMFGSGLLNLASGALNIAEAIGNVMGKFGRLAGRVIAICNYFDACHAKWRSRQQLALLEQNMLDDIGITRAQAEEEAVKPFFDESLKG